MHAKTFYGTEETNKMKMCYLVMNGETPISVYLNKKQAQAKANKCTEGWVLELPLHEED